MSNFNVIDDKTQTVITYNSLGEVVKRQGRLEYEAERENNRHKKIREFERKARVSGLPCQQRRSNILHADFSRN